MSNFFSANTSEYFWVFQLYQVDWRNLLINVQEIIIYNLRRNRFLNDVKLKLVVTWCAGNCLL